MARRKNHFGFIKPTSTVFAVLAVGSVILIVVVSFLITRLTKNKSTPQGTPTPTLTAKILNTLGITTTTSPTSPTSATSATTATTTTSATTLFNMSTENYKGILFNRLNINRNYSGNIESEIKVNDITQCADEFIKWNTSNPTRKVNFFIHNGRSDGTVISTCWLKSSSDNPPLSMGGTVGNRQGWYVQ
jgi:hypothetical protein